MQAMILIGTSVSRALYFSLSTRVGVGHLTLTWVTGYGHQDAYFRPKTCNVVLILPSLTLGRITMLVTGHILPSLGNKDWDLSRLFQMLRLLYTR